MKTYYKIIKHIQFGLLMLSISLTMPLLNNKSFAQTNTFSGNLQDERKLPLCATGITPSSIFINGGGTVTLIAPSNPPYLWSNGASGQSTNVSPTSTTTYTVVCGNGCNRCISTAIVNVCTPTFLTTTASVCGFYTWACNGQTYNTSGIYTCTSLNAQGCLHTATLNLSILNAVNSTISVSACNSYTWSANGFTYTTSGIYTTTSLNANGCINTATLNLTINTGTNTSTSATACNSYTWSASGLTYTASGIYTKTILNANGCVNTATLNLTINTGTNTSTSATACNSYTWSASGLTYTASGIYTKTILNANGCVNVAILNLTITPVCNTTLNFQAYIQGYMNGTTMNPVLQNQGQPNSASQCDSIQVELHQSISPFATLYSTTALLGTNGIATCTFPSAVNSGNYYIVIKHRNAVETWSANPVNFSGTSVSYNFSNAANMAYGSNQTQVAPGVWAIYSGDLNHDENLDLLDGAALENDINNFLFGYLATDINGDGNVDLLDLPIVEENVNNFIFSAHP